MSSMYNSIKRYYDQGLYNNDSSSNRYIGIFVQARWITKDEYEEITGESYDV